MRAVVAIALVGLVLGSALFVSVGAPAAPSHDAPAVPRSSTASSVSSRAAVSVVPSSRQIGIPRASPLSTGSAGSVVRTVFPGYNSSLPGSFTASVSSWQVGSPAYVPSTDSLWFPQRSVAVAGYPTPNVAPVAVYDLATRQFDRLITNLSNASALAYDPSNGYVYATLPAENSVAVVNPVTGSMVDAGIPVGSTPAALAFDENTNQLFVANSGSANVTVINTLNDTVKSPSISVGSDPVSIVDDPQDGFVFVANAVGAGNPHLSVINITLIGGAPISIPLTDGPAVGLAFSPRSDYLVATIPSSQYATIVHANIPTVVNSIVPVGLGFVPATTSANGTEFVLGSASSGELVTVNATTAFPNPSPILVSQDAAQLVLDPQSGSVFCWTSHARILESINLTSRVATPAGPTTAPAIGSMTYLARQSTVLASATAGSLVLALNQKGLTQSSPPVSTITAPNSIASDPTHDRWFVGNTSGVQVYNASTGKLQGAVSSLSGNCSQLVVDSSHNYLWLANSVQGYVAVNLTTLTPMIFTGLTPASMATQGIAVDSSDSNVFLLVTPDVLKVWVYGFGVVTGPGIDVGANVTSLAFDPADDQVYAAGDSVSLVNGSSLEVDGGPVLLGGSHRVLSEVYEPSREAVYVASVGLLPGLQGMVTVLDGSSIPASESSTIDVPVGESPDAFAVVPSGNEEAQGTAMIWVANALSGTISVLASPPEITYFAATPSTVDLGSSTTVGVTYQGGAGNSTVSFLGLPPGCSPSGQLEFNCTPSAAGSYSLTVKVTDSLGVSVNATTSLTVLHALSVRTTFTPSTFPHLDVGVPWVGTAVASNGLPPYVYQWSFGDGTGASTPGATHAYTSPGDYVVTTEVRDAIGVTSNSTALVVVAPRPTVAVTLSPGNETDVDLPITLQAVVSGGTGVTSESWTFGDSNEWTGPNATHAWTRAGNYTVAFSYTDALGVSANVSVSVVVHPPLGAKFSSENASAASPGAPGTPIPFSASVTGGTPPYTVQWNWGDGSYGTGLRTNHSYASPGTYSVGVTLKDAVGTNVTASFQVVIAENSSSSGSVPSAGGGFTAGLFLGLIFGGAVGAIVLFFAARRKTEHPPAGPVPPYVPP